MDHLPTAHDGLQALRDHIVERATAARMKYGLYIDADTILRMLEDRAVVRYPTQISFDAGPLQAGEFAFVQPLGDSPQAGYCIVIHPHFQKQPDLWPLLISYHLVVVNYGEVAEPAEAELFGATLLGLEVDAYYQALCELADSIPKP